MYVKPQENIHPTKAESKRVLKRPDAPFKNDFTEMLNAVEMVDSVSISGEDEKHSASQKQQSKGKNKSKLDHRQHKIDVEA